VVLLGLVEAVLSPGVDEPTRAAIEDANMEEGLGSQSDVLAIVDPVTNEVSTELRLQDVKGVELLESTAPESSHL